MDLQVVAAVNADTGPQKRRRAPLRRRPNKEIRVREYLTEDECWTLIAAAKKRGGRCGLRDALAIRMCWRHGLRISELVRAALGSRRVGDGTAHSASRQGLNRQHASDQRR